MPNQDRIQIRNFRGSRADWTLIQESSSVRIPSHQARLGVSWFSLFCSRIRLDQAYPILSRIELAQIQRGRSCHRHRCSLGLLDWQLHPPVWLSSTCFRPLFLCVCPPTMEAPDPDWSTLPADILISVLQLLECPDLLRVAAVCIVWQNAYSMVRCRNHVCPGHQTPCLLYSTEAGGVSALGMYSLSERKAYTMPLPEPPINNWIGSSQGWLVTMDEKSDLTLLNPITCDRIALPPAITMEHVKPVLNDDGVLEKYEVSYYDGELPRVKDTPYVSDLDRYGDLFYLKAILSSDTPIAECIVMLIHQPYGQLSFARAGDVRWNWLKFYSFYADCIYHDGLFYAMTNQGAIDAFSLNGPSVIHKRIFPNIVRSAGRCYIVQAPWGDVLQVNRKQKLDRERTDGETYIPVIELYKIDFVKQKRVKMRGLGDYALFIGKSTTSCFSIQDYPDLMPSHVYFTDDNHEDLATGKDDPREIGVYNLENNTIANVVYPEPWRTWFPPIWFTPNLVKKGFLDNNGGRQSSTAVVSNQSMKALRI